MQERLSRFPTAESDAAYSRLISTPAIKATAIKRWLVDSGCWHDLLSRNEVPERGECIRKAKIPITFDTANGSTRTTEVADIYVKELNAEISPYVLENTPAVISIGYRCVELGYSFFLPRGGNSLFHPSG